MRMTNIVICGLSASTVYFSHYLINATIFEKKVIEQKCVFAFSLQRCLKTFLIPRITERDMMKNVIVSSCKVFVILVQF